MAVLALLGRACFAAAGRAVSNSVGRRNCATLARRIALVTKDAKTLQPRLRAARHKRARLRERMRSLEDALYGRDFGGRRRRPGRRWQHWRQCRRVRVRRGEGRWRQPAKQRQWR